MLRRPPRSTRTDTTLSLHDALPISAYASYLSSDFVDEDFAFFGTTLNGIKENKPRWKRGVDFEESALGERSEEHTSELQSLMRISYAVFCLKKKRKKTYIQRIHESTTLVDK